MSKAQQPNQQTTTLRNYLNKVTNPQNWKTEYAQQLKKLYEDLQELRKIDKALEKALGKKGKLLSDFKDPEIRERMKTIIAGGISKKKGNNAKPIAPILWTLFGIELYPRDGGHSLNSSTDDLITYLENNGLRNVRVAKCTFYMLETIWRDLGHVLRDALERLGKSVSGDVSVDDNEVHELICKYIPKPGQEPRNLINLIKDVVENLVKLAPGVNPYTTFALCVSSVIAQDLLELVGNDTRKFEEMLRILGYKAIIDWVDQKFISYQDVDTIDTIKSELAKRELMKVLLLGTYTESYYGRSPVTIRSPLLEFIKAAYDYVGDYEECYPKRKRVIDLESLIYGKSTIKGHLINYTQREFNRIASAIKSKKLHISQMGLNGPQQFNKAWRALMLLRDSGVLYSPVLNVTYYDRISEHRLEVYANSKCLQDIACFPADQEL